MDTLYGKIVKGLIDEGAQLGIIKRYGIPNSAKRCKLCKRRLFICNGSVADIVADPSAPDAFVEGIMENKEWVWDNGVLIQKDIEDRNMKFRWQNRKFR